MAHAVLALDPATSTGWAVTDERGVPSDAGVWQPVQLKHEAETGRHGRICAFLTARLSSWIDVHLPSLIVIEENNGGPINQKVRQRITGCFLALCHRRNVLVRTVDAKTWQAWAKKHHNWTRKDKSDQADAEMILRWALANVTIKPREPI